MDRCEQHAESLSALLDGELEAGAARAFEAHLEDCSLCRAKLAAFQTVDQGLTQRTTLPSVDHEARVRAAVQARRRGARPTGPVRSGTRLLKLATAALVLIAVSLVVLVTSDEAGAHRAAVPIATIELLNEQERQDQNTLLETLEWELRSLKLQIGSLRLEPTEQAALSERVERLLRQIEQTR